MSVGSRVSDVVGRLRRRLFHRDQREHLEQVVLADVSQRADAVVEGAPLLGADLLEQRDVDRLDGLSAPLALEEVVGEAEVQDALQHLLGEVVVDAVDLLLSEEAAEKGVELAGGLEVVTEGLLDQDPRPAGVIGALDGQPARRELAEDQLVVARRHGQVEDLVGAHAPLLLDRAQDLRHVVVGVEIIELAALVAEERKERLDVLRGGGGRALGQDSPHVCLQLGIAPFATAEAHNHELLGQKALSHEVEERRHDLARHQVSGRTEDDQDRGRKPCRMVLSHE